MKKSFIIIMSCILLVMNMPVEAMAANQMEHAVEEAADTEVNVGATTGESEVIGTSQTVGRFETIGRPEINDESEIAGDDKATLDTECSDEIENKDETALDTERPDEIADKDETASDTDLPEDIVNEEAADAVSEFMIEDSITGVDGKVFTIARPDPAAIKKVNSSEFGLSTENEDNYKAFQAALNYCKSNPNTCLEIDKGIYHFRTNERLSLSNFNNVLIDGNGSEFIFSTPDYFKIEKCNGLEIRELAIEWDWESSRLGSLVRVSKCNKPARTFEIEFIELDEVDLDIPIICFMQFDKDALIPGTYGGYRTFYPDQVKNGIVKREKVAPNKIKIYCGEESYINTFHDEEVFLIRHYTYGGRVFQPSQSENITFDDVHIYSAAGMGYIVSDRTKKFQIINSSIGRRTDRPDAPYISTTADGIHILNTGGYFRIENCDFSFTGDDIINIHDDVMAITRRVSDTVLEGKVTGTFVGPGDKVRFKNSQMGLIEGCEDYEVEVAEFSRHNDDATITFKTPVDSEIDGGDFIYRSSLCTSNYVIRNNYIHETKGRAMLLLASNALIENNTIYRTVSEGIHILADVDPNGVGSGGYGPCNVTLRGNTFTECTVSYKKPVVMVSYKKGDEVSEYSDVLSNIALENNSFIGCYVDAIQADNVTNLTVTGNLVQDSGQIIIGKNCENTNVTGNTFTTAEHLDTHDVIKIHGRAPSCVSYGTKTEEFCNDCHRQITEMVAINPIPHNKDVVIVTNKIDVTCTTDGYWDEEYFCSMCDQSMGSEHKTEEATGHKYENGKCMLCGVSNVPVPVDDEGNPLDDINDVPDKLWVTGIKRNLVYTGSKIKQSSMRVYWGNDLLELNKDYTVKYQNNINAYELQKGEEGFSSKLAPTVIITGKGNYSGTIKETYPIWKIDIGSAIPFDKEITIASNGKVQKPTTTFKVQVGGKNVTLKNGTDYKYIYPEIKEPNEDNKPYVVKVMGKGNYKGECSFNVYVVKDVIPVSKLTVKKIPNQAYTGETVNPTGVVVSYGKKVLKGIYVDENNPMDPGQEYDYIIEPAAANTDIGVGTLTIRGNGNKYVGQKNVKFNIVGTSISKATVEGLGSFVFTGSEIQPHAYDPETGIGYRVYITGTKATPKIELEKDKDYKVSFDNNTNAGTATITFTGINGYSGVLNKSFKISRVSVANADRIKIDSIESVVYQKNGAKPVVTIRDNENALTLGKDYKVTYSNANAVHDGINGSKKPTITITGKGNYTGTTTATFAISGSSLKNTVMKASDIVATNKANICKPTIKLYDSNGSALKAGVDYNSAVTYTYVNNTTVKRLVNKKKESFDVEAGTPVNKADIIPADTEIKAKVTGKGFYCDSQETTFRYVATNISSAKVVIPNMVYTRHPITLESDNPDDYNIQVSMTINKKKVVLDPVTDYVITGYKKNTNKGTAKVTIKGLGAFGGTKEVSFKIVAKTLNHTVKLHSNNGSAKEIVKIINIASGTKLPANTFKVTGKKFTGWNTKADGTGTAYTEREAVVRNYLSIMIFGDTLDLYAQWE